MHGDGLSMNPCDKLLIRHREHSEAIQLFGPVFLDGHGLSGLAMTVGCHVQGQWAFPEREGDLATLDRLLPLAGEAWDGGNEGTPATQGRDLT